jgi:hypothetical protein
MNRREGRGPTELTVVRRYYEFLVWLLPVVAGMPRQHRFTLGERIERLAVAILEALVAATYTGEKRELLERANLCLELLRYLLRLAKDLKLLSVAQYGSGCTALAEVGSQVGGWLKQQARISHGAQAREPV